MTNNQPPEKAATPRVRFELLVLPSGILLEGQFPDQGSTPGYKTADICVSFSEAAEAMQGRVDAYNT